MSPPRIPAPCGPASRTRTPPEVATRRPHPPTPNPARSRQRPSPVRQSTHTWSQTFRDLNHLLNALFGFANVLVVHRSRIELHQRQFPFARDRPRTHALAAAQRAENDHASRWLQAKRTRLILPSTPPLCQPVLQIV